MDSIETPGVIVKGVGFLAPGIEELAQEDDIPLVKNRPPARALHKSV